MKICVNLWLNIYFFWHRFHRFHRFFIFHLSFTRRRESIFEPRVTRPEPRFYSLFKSHRGHRELREVLKLFIFENSILFSPPQANRISCLGFFILSALRCTLLFNLFCILHTIFYNIISYILYKLWTWKSREF